eukprot:comp20967_c0_seq1/m.28058 comp20967_c0_seq1/g.28058  ORF comp20967_c0_seq1/g.28058 comp20967_c0_seq1/m.28058 type:complete len:424 (-) comp20967_c0_seq1:171-1442(-)
MVEVDQNGHSATDQTPLMGEKGKETQTPQSSPLQSFINLVKIAIGSGILTLPYGFSKGGVLSGVVLLIIVAGFNFISVYWLVRSFSRVSPEAIRNTKSSYSAVGWEAAGKWGVYSVDIAIVVTSVGAAITYLIFIENTMYDVTQVLKQRDWVLLGMIPLVCLVCLDDLSFLTWVSIGGIVALFVGFASVFGYGFSTQHFDIAVSDMVIPTGVPQLFCLIVFAYAYPCVFFPIYEQMRKKNDAEFFKVFGMALAVVVAVFATLGAVAMGCYKEAGIKEIIINNLPTQSVYANLVRCALSIVILLSYPLAFFIFNQIVGRYSKQLVSSEHAKKAIDYSSRIGALLLSGVLAILFPKMADVVSVLGAFSINYLCFVFPPYAYLKICGPEISKTERTLVSLFFVLAFFIMGYTTYSSIDTLIRHMNA